MHDPDGAPATVPVESAAASAADDLVMGFDYLAASAEIEPGQSVLELGVGRDDTVEDLAVADGSVDVVLADRAITSAADKGRAFEEVMRVLKPGGRLETADVVLLREVPAAGATDAGSSVADAAGAVQKWEYMLYLRAAGFAWAAVQSESTHGGQGSPFVKIHVSALKGDLALGGGC
jgi:SAM-dependent methyltransferase